MKTFLPLLFVFVLGICVGNGLIPINWHVMGWYVAGALVVALLVLLNMATPRWWY